MFPAAPNVPLTRLTGLLNAVDECSVPTMGEGFAFVERARGLGGYGEVPASVGHHLTSFATWGTWFLLPKLASGTCTLEDLTPPLVPESFRTRFCSACGLVCQPSHHLPLPTRASNKGLEILT